MVPGNGRNGWGCREIFYLSGSGHFRNLRLVQQHTPVQVHRPLPGRQQVIAEPVWQMFDVAHNPEGIAALAETLEKERRSYPGIQVVAVFSMLRDKNIETCVKIIAPHIDVWHVAGLAVERGMTSVEMGDRVSSVTSSPVYVHSDLIEAFDAALAGARRQKETRVLVFGSFHTVASLLAS